MKRSTMNNQLVSINSALPFIGVLQSDKLNRPTVLKIPGSEGKSYNVIIKRIDFQGLIEVECNLDCNHHGYQPCKGNSKTICKHSRAAINFLMIKAGFKVRWFDSYEKAYRMMMAGKIIVIKSKQSSDKAWVVINK